MSSSIIIIIFLNFNLGYVIYYNQLFYRIRIDVSVTNIKLQLNDLKKLKLNILHKFK